MVVGVVGGGVFVVLVAVMKNQLELIKIEVVLSL